MAESRSSTNAGSVGDPEETTTVEFEACDTVLNIPELLENILAHLDNMKTLFVIQRVDKHWQAVIHESVNLQRTMFLRPSGRPIKTRLLNREKTPRDRSFKWLWPGRALPEPLLGVPMHLPPKSVTFRVLNPLLKPRHRYAFGTARFEHDGDDDILDETIFFDFDMAFRGSHTYQAMQLTDPPCQKLGGEIWYSPGEGKIYRVPGVELQNASGITFADIVGFVLRDLESGKDEEQRRMALRGVGLDERECFWKDILGGGVRALIGHPSTLAFLDDTLIVTPEEMEVM